MKLSAKTKETLLAEPDEVADGIASHPFDRWLQSELRALNGDPATDSLPPDIAELVAKLEERFSGAGSHVREPDVERSDEDQ